jgi:hypothetical protein
MNASVRWKTAAALAGVALLTCCPGCGPNHVETDVGPLPNGVKFKFLYPNAAPYPRSSSKADSPAGYSYTWARGDLTVEGGAARLKVGGRDYGPLKAGDSVVVDIRGALVVKVNGDERKPVEGEGAPKPQP